MTPRPGRAPGQIENALPAAMETDYSPGTDGSAMLELDGGEAGGQFLRTALTLSVLVDAPVRIENVRGDRPEPGLAHQHLAVVDALARLSDADVEGAEIGAETVAFEPGPVRPRAVEVDVGTAGSLSLLFDAVLPLGAVVDEPFSLTAAGGTEVAWSPPLSYLQGVKLPVLRRRGVTAAVERERSGFYPAGGGRATLHVGPAGLTAFDLTERASGAGVDIVSMASEGLGDSDVAERQVAAARERLDAAGLSVRHGTATYADTESPGSAILVALSDGKTRAGFSALGEPGKPAEDVGREAADPAVSFHESGGAVVDRHLADQLVVYLAVAGGRVCVPEVTDHVASSLRLVEAFGAETTVDRTGEAVAVSIDPIP